MCNSMPSVEDGKKTTIDLNDLNKKIYFGENLKTVYLTPRERDCAYWVMQYLTNKEIAIKLQVATTTVNNYITILKKKLGCFSKLQLALTLRERLDKDL